MAKLPSHRIADLEELTLRIHNQFEKQVFDEAIQCYFIGALRASIILAWIVATDNLTSKLELLAKEDGEAKKRWDVIQNKRNRDENFEEDLLNAYGPGALDIFDSRQIQQLQYVRRIRNWCAHATDYQPTPEESRNCLRLLVDIALSLPTYRGYRYIAQLGEQIKDGSFLPVRDYKPIVSDILLRIRPGLYKAITEKLVDTATEPTSTFDTVQNAKRFLGAMLELFKADNIALQNVLPDIKRLIAKSLDLSCDVISDNPEIVTLCDFQERERLIRYLLNDGYLPTRQKLLENLIQIEFSINKNPESIKKQIEAKYNLIPNIVKEFSTQLVTGIYEQIIPSLEYNGFNNFSVNNEAAANFQKLGVDFFDVLSDEQKSRIIRAIIDGAINGSNGPFEILEKARNWPPSWIRILGKEFPKVLETKVRVLYSPSLVVNVLKAILSIKEKLPEDWLPILKVEEDNTIKWYADESWKLYESLQSINQSFKDNGNPSSELEIFLSNIVPF